MSSNKFPKSDDRFKKSDRYLVTEQPGMFVLILGLAVSFLIGYTVRSLLSPQRVAAKISEAAKHIHKDVNIVFKSAEVSLRYSVFPRFAVVIRNVEMSSSNPCWGAPLVKVDELRLPISIKGLFSGESVVEVIRADHIDLHFRADPRTCGAKTQELVAAAAAENNLSKSSELQESKKTKKYKNEIRSISFQSIQIRSDQFPQYDSEFKDFNIDVKSLEPREIALTAKTALLKEVKAYDPRTYTNLLLEYREFPEPSLRAHIFGNWREGHYSLIANYTLLDSLLGVEADVNYLPIGRLVELSQQYGIASVGEINGRGNWLSGRLKFSGPVEKLRDTPLQFKDLKLEGDLGFVGVEDLTLQSIDSLKTENVRVEIKELDIQKLATFFKLDFPTSAISNYGKFSGRITSKDGRDYAYIGELKDVKLVFKNRGRQSIQVVPSMVLEGQYKSELLKLKISRVALDKGSFLGDVQVSLDREKKLIAGDLKIDELTFSDEVVQLLTDGGTLSPLRISLDLQYDLEKKDLHLDGVYSVREFGLTGLKLKENRGEFYKNRADQFIVKHKSKEVEVNRASNAGRILSSFTDERWWRQDIADLEKVQLELDLKDYRSLRWSKLSISAGQSSPSVIATSQGGWDKDSNLHGEVVVKTGKSFEYYDVSGTRRNPVLEKKK